MNYREIPKDKILRFSGTPGFKGWKDYFTEDSITHPAKMNLNLLRWILKTYTKPGEIVLDPMAGTGSTIVLASLLGRHGIAVEYEPRFCEMIRENIKRTSRQSTLTPKGRMTCIQGDARELSKLLKESYVIITSPPYSKTVSGDEESQERYDKFARGNWKGRWAGIQRIKAGYSKDPSNIGNLPHGDIEAIVTSPPYVPKGDRKVPWGHRHGALEEDDRKRGFNGTGGFRGSYSDDPKNIGNPRKYGEVDSIVTSPPFGPSTRGGGIFKEGYKAPGEDEVSDPGLPERHARPLSDDPRNIDNLEYGKVDAVVTSPPYSLTREGSDRIATGIDVKTGKSLWNKTGSEFSEGNIQKLPHGDVDAVITSPPYEGSIPAYDEKWLEEHWDDESDSPKHKTMRFGRSMKGYPKKVDAVVTSPPYGNRLADDVVQDGDEARMSYRQAIDSIVTSPPYEQTASSKQHGRDPKPHLAQGGIGCENINIGYSEDSDNIGNLKSESYLEAMLQCYREFYKVLKFEGIMILVTKNFIRNKAVVRLDLDTIRLAENVGFILKDRLYFKLPTRSFWRILYHKKYPDVPEIEYEDVLIFGKEAEK